MSDINNQQKYYIKDTTESKYTLEMGFHGYHNIYIIQKIIKIY